MEKKFYATTGNENAHDIKGKTWDKDTVLQLQEKNAFDAVQNLNANFGEKWESIFVENDPKTLLAKFPKGIIQQ